MSNQLLDAALSYAAKGWAVLPLHTPTLDGKCSCGKTDCKGKHPRTPHGVKDNTRDPETIRQWWTLWPDANIGLATGTPSGGALALDFDDAETFPLWRESINGLGDRLTIQQTGRGYQVILRCDQPGANAKLAYLADGKTVAIETRGDGGYIMAAPSLHPNGKHYQVTQGSFTAVSHVGMADVDLLIDHARALDQTPKTPADPWQVFTLADAYRPRAPTEYAVMGLFALPSLSILYGAPGTLKSLLLADSAVCVSAGHSWLDVRPGGAGVTPFGVRQFPVMWIDCDNGQRRTHERFAALGKARNLAADAPLYYVSMPDPPLDASDRDGLGALAARIVTRGIKLVMIDNLGLISGAVDENSADMGAIMAGLRWLAEYTGAAVVVIHHQRKSNGSGAREGETLRGHSSIEASIDLALLVSRDDGEPMVTIKATKARDCEVKPFGALFAFDPGLDGALASARFYGVPFESYADKAKDELKAQIIAALTDGPMNWTQVKDEVGGRAEILKTALDELVRARQITRTAGARGAKIFSLPTGTGQGD